MGWDNNGLHIGLLHADGTNGETLKLTTGKMVDVTVIDMTKLCLVSADENLA
jgi:hypothetical protein